MKPIIYMQRIKQSLQLVGIMEDIKMLVADFFRGSDINHFIEPLVNSYIDLYAYLSPYCLCHVLNKYCLQMAAGRSI